MAKNKKSNQNGRLSICKMIPYNLAGDESHASNPLIADFMLLAQKLEKVGFIYHRGSVVMIEAGEQDG